MRNFGQPPSESHVASLTQPPCLEGVEDRGAYKKASGNIGEQPEGGDCGESSYK